MVLNAIKSPGRRVALSLVLASVFWLLLSAAGYAQHVAETPAEYRFGQQASFSLRLPPTSPTRQATLFLRIANTLTRAYSVEVNNGLATYEYALREFPWPPFAPITYWWEYDGRTTPRESFLYEDNRFTWRTHNDGGLTVHWVAGESTLMINALDIAQQARQNIEGTLHAPPMDSLSLYIYPSLPDLQSALRLTGHEWVAGQSYPHLQVILLAIPATPEAVLQMQRDIPHELTHQIHYNLVGDLGYVAQPTWLREGLAAHFETRPDPAYVVALETARTSNQLLEMASLCYPFPEERGRALLAYAQSQSFVNYVQRTYGWATLRALIHAYADGQDCSAGAVQAFGKDLSTLEREWRVWLERQAQADKTGDPWIAGAVVILRDLTPWLTLLLVTLLPGAVFVLLTRLEQLRSP